jgi:hypothetical protein
MRKTQRGSWEYRDTKFGHPERIEFKSGDLIDVSHRG